MDFTRLLSLLGIKGRDGTSIATDVNPLPVTDGVNTRDTANEQTMPLGANGVFVTTGPATRIDTVGSVQILYASVSPFTASILWYSDATTPMTGSFASSALSVRQLNGYYVVYQVYSGDIIGPYYKLQVTNGSTPQGAFPLFISITWLNKDPYNGVFDFVDAEPSQLTKGMVVKQFHQKTTRLTNTPLTLPATFTADATTDLITKTAHGLIAGQTLRLSTTGTLPAPFVAGTTYFVRDVSTDTFKLAATYTGAAIDITTAGAGVHTYTPYFTTKGLTAGNFTANANGYFAGTNWADLDIHIWGAPFNAKGTLTFYFSHDGVDDHIGPVQVPINDLSAALPEPLRNYAYWRIEYDNGSPLGIVAQTKFGVFIVQRASVASDITRLLTQVIGPAEPVKVVRSLIEPSIVGARGLLGADRTASGEALTAQRLKIIDFPWFAYDPNHVLQTTGTGTMTKLTTGAAQFSTTTKGTVFRAQTYNTVPYRSASESHFFETLRGVQIPTHANSYMYMGPISTVCGFAFGWKGGVFGVVHRNAGVDDFKDITKFNGDSLVGNSLSRYSRGDLVEPLDMTKLNPMRILMEWFGAAPTFTQTINPDGNWMSAHTYKWPNSRDDPFLSNPDLPMAVEIYLDPAEAQSAGTMTSGCWEAGNSGAKTEFERILGAEVRTGEQFILDVQPTSANFYIGVAFRGASQSNPVWSVIKIARDPTTKKPTGIDFLERIAWSTRTSAAWVI